MKEYIKKGYSRKLCDKEANTISPRTNYIPHNSVTNINNPISYVLSLIQPPSFQTRL